MKTLMILIFLIFSLSRASETLQESVRDVLVTESVRLITDKQLGTINALGVDAGVGSTLLSVWSLYNAVESFKESETKSQKFYSTAAGVSAGATIVAPVVGLTLGLSAMTCQAVGMAGAKASIKRAMKTREEIAKIYKRIAGRHKTMLDFDINQFLDTQKYLNEKLVQIQVVSQFLENYCSTRKNIDGIETLNQCLIQLFNKESLLENFVKVSMDLVRTEGAYISLTQALRENNINIEEYNLNITKIESDLTSFKLYVKLITESLRKLKIEIYKLDAVSANQQDEVACESFVSDNVEQLNHLIRGQVRSRYAEEIFKFKSKIHDLKKTIRSYINKVCPSFKNNKNLLYQYIQENYPDVLI